MVPPCYSQYQLVITISRYIMVPPCYSQYKLVITISRYIMVPPCYSQYQLVITISRYIMVPPCYSQYQLVITISRYIMVPPCYSQYKLVITISRYYDTSMLLYSYTAKLKDLNEKCSLVTDMCKSNYVCSICPEAPLSDPTCLRAPVQSSKFHIMTQVRACLIIHYVYNCTSMNILVHIHLH